MRCDTKAFWFALLGFMATLAWGSEDVAINSQTNGEKGANTANNRNNKKLARKQYLSSNSWGARVVPGAARSKPGRYYDEDDDDEDEDESGYYGESSYGSYGESSYGYAPSYAPSYAPQIQIPQVQAYQPSYYYQQQQPSIVPVYIQSGSNNYHKKKKKRPICCCDTTKCLEQCDTATNTECACDLRCCARYNSTGCPTPTTSRLGTKVVYLRQFDNILSEEYYDEEVPEN